MGTPDDLRTLFSKIDVLTDKVSETNLLLEKQNSRIEIMEIKKADREYVDQKTSEKPLMSPGQKKMAIGALVTIASAVAAMLTAKFGV